MAYSSRKVAGEGDDDGDVDGGGLPVTAVAKPEQIKKVIMLSITAFILYVLMIL